MAQHAKRARSTRKVCYDKPLFITVSYKFCEQELPATQTLQLSILCTTRYGIAFYSCV